MSGSMNFSHYHPSWEGREFSKQTYTSILTKVFEKKKNQSLMVHDTLKVIGWIQKAIQTVKGWLGLENKADIIKVNYELLKFLRYGQVHHFLDDQQIAQIVGRLGEKFSKEPQHKIIADLIPKILHPQLQESHSLDDEITRYYSVHAKNHLRDARWTRVFKSKTAGTKSDKAILQYNMARVDVSAKKYGEAVNKLEKAIKLAPERVKWNSLLGLTALEQAHELIKQEHLQDAVVVCNKAIEAFKKSLETQSQDSLELRKKLHQAYVLKCAIQISLNLPQDAHQTTLQAAEYFKQQYNFIDEIELLLKSRSTPLPYYEYTGFFYAICAESESNDNNKINLYYKAKSHLEAATVKYPQVAETLLKVCLVLSKHQLTHQQDEEGHKLTLHSVFVYNFNDAKIAEPYKSKMLECLELSACQQLQKQNYSAVLDLCQQAETINPALHFNDMKFVCHKGIGDSEYNDKKFESALQEYIKALDLASTKEDKKQIAAKLVSCGHALLSTNKSAALEAYRKALPLVTEPNHLFIMHQQLGMAEIEKGVWAQAAIYLEQARAIRPSHPQVLKDLLQCYEQLKDPKKIIEIKEALIKSTEHSADYHVDLAKLYIEQNDHEQALNHYEEAEKVSSKGRYQREIFDCQMALGDKAKDHNPVLAIEQYKKALLRADSENVESSTKLKERVAHRLLDGCKLAMKSNLDAAEDAMMVAAEFIRIDDNTRIDLCLCKAARAKNKGDLDGLANVFINCTGIGEQEFYGAIAEYADNLAELTKNAKTEDECRKLIFWAQAIAKSWLVMEDPGLTPHLLKIAHAAYPQFPELAMTVYQPLLYIKGSYRKDPEIILGFYNMASYLAKLPKEQADADIYTPIECLSQAAKIGEFTNQEILIELADLQLADGQLEEALQSYQRALALEPANQQLLKKCADLEIKLATLLFEKGVHSPDTFRQSLIDFIAQVKQAPYSQEIRKAFSTYFSSGEYGLLDKLKGGTPAETARDILKACEILEKAYDGGKNHLDSKSMPADLRRNIEKMKQKVKDAVLFKLNIEREVQIYCGEKTNFDLNKANGMTTDQWLHILEKVDVSEKVIKISEERGIKIATSSNAWMHYAVDHYRKALKLQPDVFAPEYNNFISALIQIGDEKSKIEAVNLHEGFKKKFPDARLQPIPDHVYQDVRNKLTPEQRLERVLHLAKQHTEGQRFDAALDQYDLALGMAKDNEKATIVEKILAIAERTKTEEIIKKAYTLILPYLEQHVPIKKQAEIHFFLGTVAKQVDHVRAIEHFNKALAITPDDLSAWGHLSDIYFNQQQIDLAVDAQSKATKSSPLQAAIVLAEKAHKAGFHTMVVNYYEKALSFNPRDEKLLIKIADSFVNSHLLEQASEYYKKLMSLAPDNADYRRIYRQNELEIGNELYRKNLNDNQKVQQELVNFITFVKKAPFSQDIRRALSFYKSKTGLAFLGFTGEYGKLDEFGKKATLRETCIEIEQACAIIRKAYDGQHPHMQPNQMPKELAERLHRIRQHAETLRQYYKNIVRAGDDLISNLLKTEYASEFNQLEPGHNPSDFSHADRIVKQAQNLIAAVKRVQARAKTPLKKDTLDLLTRLEQSLSSHAWIQQALPHYLKAYELAPNVFDSSYNHIVDAYMKIKDFAAAGKFYVTLKKKFPEENVVFCDPEKEGSLREQLSNEDLFNLRMDSGTHYESKGDYNTSLHKYMEAFSVAKLEQLGRLAEKIMVIGDFFTREGKIADAVKAYDKLFAHISQLNWSEDKIFDLYVKLARGYKELKIEEKALKYYASALEIYPRSPEVLSDMGVIFDGQGDIVTASQHHRKAFIEAINLGWPDSRMGELRTHLFRSEIRMGDLNFEHAHNLQAREEIVHESQKTLEIMQNTILTALNSSQGTHIKNALKRGWLGFKGLIDELNDLEKIPDGSKPEVVLRGAIRSVEILKIAYDGKKDHLHEKDMDPEIREHMESLSKQIGIHSELQKKCAAAPKTERKAHEYINIALGHYQEAVRLKPDEHGPHLDSMIKANTMLGKDAEAVHLREKFKAQFPDKVVQKMDPKAYIARMEALKGQEKIKEAIQLCHKAMTEFPDEVAYKDWLSDFYYSVGENFLKKRDIVKAFEFFERALKIHGYKAKASRYAALATHYYKAYNTRKVDIGEDDTTRAYLAKAIEMRKEAADADKKNAKYQFECGKIAYKHEADFSLPYCERAVALDPKNIAYAYGVVACLINKHGQNHPIVDKARERLLSLKDLITGQDIAEWTL